MNDEEILLDIAVASSVSFVRDRELNINGVSLNELIFYAGCDGNRQRMMSCVPVDALMHHRFNQVSRAYITNDDTSLAVFGISREELKCFIDVNDTFRAYIRSNCDINVNGHLAAYLTDLKELATEERFKRLEPLFKDIRELYNFENLL